MFTGILQGLETVLSLNNLMFVFLGCLAGTLIGMLPGLGPISAIALMVPISYGLEPSTGMILMAGVYYGAIFGGSTSSILLNAPGVAGTVASAFDGYPLAKNGQAGKALAVAAYSSFTGGTLAALFLLIAAPLLAGVSKSFHSADYFLLTVLGLTAVAAFAGKGGFLKSILMTVVGLMLATVGTDQTSGASRFTLGHVELVDGISFLLLAMASFALAEALHSVLFGGEDSRECQNQSITDLRLSKNDFKLMAPVTLRSSILGFFVGTLPGAGATIASFLAYGMEQAFATDQEKKKFGKGSIVGLAAPESANNAACSGSFVPLLTLGIPGSGTTAVLLGALLSYGIQPGPRLYIEAPEVFWSVIISMYIGNLVLLALNLPLIPHLAKLLSIPRNLLVPYIIFFSMVGVYLISFNLFDLRLMVLFAAASLLFRCLEFPLSPMLLGFILGGMLEDNLRRALIINDGSFRFLSF